VHLSIYAAIKITLSNKEKLKRYLDVLFLEPLISTGGPLYQMNLLKNNLKHDKLP